MSKLKGFLNLSNTKTVEDVSRYYSIVLDEIKGIINGNVSFAENIQCSRITATFVSAGAEIIVNHALGLAPTGYFVVGRDAAITVYDGTTPWTDKYISLRAGGAGTATVLVFV